MKKLKTIYWLIIFNLFLGITYAQNVNLPLGNPSNATTSAGDENNYLVPHNGFILSYSRERGQPNWVAWHVQKSDLGTKERSNKFAPDMSLPAAWRIRPTEYYGKQTGYQRGHMCPSADRTATDEANIETFLMSNMSPQLPQLNEKGWALLEKEIRELVRAGNEAYVYAGCYGERGKIRDKITIPQRCFKIALILPQGGNDLARINQNTQVVSVDMPNIKSVRVNWRRYITTIDAIEQATGYDFFSTLPADIQDSLESKK